MRVYDGCVKPFDSRLFDLHDASARVAVSDWLSDLGYWVHHNPNKYGVDLIAELDGKSRAVEVEVKIGWVDLFPFESLHIPARKAKFAGPDSVFCILNRDHSKLVAVTGDLVAMCGFVQKSTSLTQEPDLFFEVPLKFVYFYDLKKPRVHD